MKRNDRDRESERERVREERREGEGEKDKEGKRIYGKEEEAPCLTSKKFLRMEMMK